MTAKKPTAMVSLISAIDKDMTSVYAKHLKAIAVKVAARAKPRVDPKSSCKTEKG
jgi:hypothetical protein